MAQSKASSSKKKSSGKSTKAKSSAPKKTASTRAASSRPTPAREQRRPIRREVGGGFCLLLMVLLILSFISTDGDLIALVSNFVKGLVGLGYWTTVPALLILSLILFFHNGRPVGGRVFTALMLPILYAAMAHMLQSPPTGEAIDLSMDAADLFNKGQVLASGGALGGLLALILTKALSNIGAWLVLAVGFVLCLVIALRGTLRGSVSGLAGRAKEAISRIPAYKPEDYEQPQVVVPELDGPQRPAQAAAWTQTPKIERLTPESILDIPLGETGDTPPVLKPPKTDGKTGRTRTKVSRKPDPVPTPVSDPLADDEEFGFRDLNGNGLKPPVNGGRTTVAPTPAPAPVRPSPAPVTPTPVPVVPTPVPTKRPAGPVPAPAAEPPIDIPAEDGQKPKNTRLPAGELQEETRKIDNEIKSQTPAPEYVFPPTELLTENTEGTVDGRREIDANRERLEVALHSFGINAAICDVTRGPSVTRYDIELEQGVKLARVTNLAGDLALALGVVNVRIAPIPNKISTVGIEVPNRIVSKVYLRELLESQAFRTAKSRLSFGIGKDIAGTCVIGNISKLPHMLIAGTTGSGKSVCMNSLILSLLYKARPDEVRLIMIDPKMVELGIYNGIPHLFIPVVTDPKKAAGALQWAVVEMLKRYRLFSEAGVRDLESYNRHCKAQGQETLPAVVIVIDELADLMLVAAKDVEESICRVAQMGRASGMHLVIATQRPSADVITGLMKANIPSRIAFAVSSGLESRIILDQVGAEKLIGMGDMLYSPVGMGKPLRVQGAFVSDEEREEVIRFIKENAGETQGQDETGREIEQFIQNKDAEEKAGKDGKDSGKAETGAASGYDELLPQCVEIVLEMGSCSVSMLQRRAKLGYARAARIVDQMAEIGVIGPYEGAKPRAVTMTREQWQAKMVELGYASANDMALAAEMSAESDADFAEAE